MGLFGGGNSSSTTYNQDQRQLVDSHNETTTTSTSTSTSNFYADNSVHVLSDGGAVDAGLKAFEEAGGIAHDSIAALESIFAKANGQTSDALSFAQRVQSESLGAANNAIDKAFSATPATAGTGLTTQLIVALVVAVLTPYLLKAVKS